MNSEPAITELPPIEQAAQLDRQADALLHLGFHAIVFC
jgi:hypothetical protein